MEVNISAEDTLEFRSAAAIDLYVPPILVIVGTVCNILVVMVMQSSYFRSLSTSLYMSINAVVDIASLDLVLPAHWLYVNFPWIFIRNDNSHIMCKFFNFFGWASSDLGIILTVAMTTERAIAVTFPLKAASLCSKRRAKIVMVNLSVFISLKDLHFLLKSDLVPKDETEQLCTVVLNDPKYAFFWTNIWPWVHNMFLCLSFIIIGISNVIILKNVRRASSDSVSGYGRKSMQNSAKMESRGRQMSILLIIDSLMIIVCTLPFSLIIIINSAFPLFGDTPHQIGLSKLLFGLSFYLLYVNRCANFYLYCIGGSRFRMALRKTVCCCKHGADDSFTTISKTCEAAQNNKKVLRRSNGETESTLDGYM